VDGDLVYNEEAAIRCFRLLQQKGYETIAIKLPRSASGNGFLKSKTEDDFIQYLHHPIANHYLSTSDHLQHQGQDYNLRGLRIEGWIDEKDSNTDNQSRVIASPGVLIKVGADSAEDKIISATDQILNNCIHIGNVWPIQYWNNEMARALKVVADWARELGYTDVLSVDFIMVQEKNNIIPYVTEINGRITGQTHGAMMIHNLYGSTFRDDIAWSLDNNVHIPVNMSLNDYVLHLEKNKLAFDINQGGVMVINHNTKYAGKTQVIIAVPNKYSKISDTRKMIEEKRQLAKA
jgi:hypothetical protein